MNGLFVLISKTIRKKPIHESSFFFAPDGLRYAGISGDTSQDAWGAIEGSQSDLRWFDVDLGILVPPTLQYISELDTQVTVWVPEWYFKDFGVKNNACGMLHSTETNL